MNMHYYYKSEHGRLHHGVNLSLYDRRPGRLRLISPLTQQKTSAIRNRRKWEREGASAFATVKNPRGTSFPHARRTPLVSILFDAGAELASGTPTVAPGATVIIYSRNLVPTAA